MKNINFGIKKTGLLIALFSFMLVFFFQNCAPPAVDKGTETTPSAATNETTDRPPTEKVSALKKCDKIRYSFKTFTSEITDESGTYYGGKFFPYSSSAFPWLVDRPISEYNTRFVPTYRLAGYVIESNDCGQTWTRTPEYINPMILNGGPDSIDECSANEQRGNGVNHFITAPNANFFSQGFVSQIRWDQEFLMRSRIYSIFNSEGTWSYSATKKMSPIRQLEILIGKILITFILPQL
jgi:hypothetical protein